jgi:hypothetical protein
MSEASERLTRGGDATAYELVTRTRLEAIADQVNRIEAKVNALLVAALAGLTIEAIKAMLR